MKKLLIWTSLFFILAINSLIAQTLIIDRAMTLTNGTFDVVEIRHDGLLTVDGAVSIGNINVILNTRGFITVTKKGELTLRSSLNMNGNITVKNYGVFSSGNVEMQNGSTVQNANYFFNYGTHNVKGDLQINSDYSSYHNEGELYVSNYTNFHRGWFIFAGCGLLDTYGLNVNKENRVSGSGFIKVNGNLNMNQNLTQSNEIRLCYLNGTINKSGSAILTCEPGCKKDPLPLRIADVSVKTVENNIIRISFRVTENSNLQQVKVRYSLDAKTFREVLIISPNVLKVGSVYSATFESVK